MSACRRRLRIALQLGSIVLTVFSAAAARAQTPTGAAAKSAQPVAAEYPPHSFVESSEMMNSYNGNVTTDANGSALVQLPDAFSALNRDFSYQLTVIGTFAQSIVAEKMADNHSASRPACRTSRSAGR